jgi:capsular polysaccharide biosynthesis protein
MLIEETTPGRGSKYSPQRILQTIRRRMWTIVLVAVVTTGAALGFSMLQTPTYEASVQILVGQKVTGGKYPNPGVANVSDLQEVAQTVAQAVPTTPIAEAVVEQLDLQEESAENVLGNISAEPDPGTMFVNVSYKDSDPERAQLIANTIGKVLSEKISEVSVGANAITATVWEPATLPETPISPDPIRNGLIALVVGSVLGVILAFLLEYVDDRWNSRDEVEEISGTPTLGVIPKFKLPATRKVRASARRRAILAKKEGER